MCPTSRRVEVLKECQARGIPTVVWFSPLLPFLNDTMENAEGILNYCIEAGVKAILCFGIGVTMREGNREYFYGALDRAAARFPQDQRFQGIKDRYIKTYGYSYEVTSPSNNRIMSYLSKTCSRNKIMFGTDKVFKWMEEFPEDSLQPSLF